MKKYLILCICFILLIANIVVPSRATTYLLAEEIGINSTNYIVVDDNGCVLIESNADEKKEVASICKLMTTLLTLEKIERGELNLDDKFVASEYACSVQGSQAFLDPGSQYSVKDLLKSVIVASANDSAIVLAENIAGSEELFVKMMNLRAAELGMKNTLYGNSTGLDDKRQYSTARDTAIILDKISDFEIYKNDCKIWMDKLVHPSGRETELVNTNRLIRYYQYCNTGKTGYTDNAGYCLSSTANKDDMKLTCVVLGCDAPSDRFTDSVALYNYCFANFENEKIVDKELLLDIGVKVESGKQDNLKIASVEDFYITHKKGEKIEYNIKYNLPEKLLAPIVENNVIGNAVVLVDGEVVGNFNIIAKESIDKQSYKDIVRKIVSEFSLIK